MPSAVSENFDESFGDTDSVPKIREDELVHWGSFRLRMVSSLLLVSDKLLEKSKQIEIPWLVRLCCPAVMHVVHVSINVCWRL